MLIGSMARGDTSEKTLTRHTTTMMTRERLKSLGDSSWTDRSSSDLEEFKAPRELLQRRELRLHFKEWIRATDLVTAIRFMFTGLCGCDSIHALFLGFLLLLLFRCRTCLYMMNHVFSWFTVVLTTIVKPLQADASHRKTRHYMPRCHCTGEYLSLKRQGHKKPQSSNLKSIIHTRHILSCENDRTTSNTQKGSVRRQRVVCCHGSSGGVNSGMARDATNLSHDASFHDVMSLAAYYEVSNDDQEVTDEVAARAERV